MVMHGSVSRGAPVCWLSTEASIPIGLLLCNYMLTCCRCCALRPSCLLRKRAGLLLQFTLHQEARFSMV